MMSKKKKDKTDEPAKTKTKRSSSKASHKGASVIDGAPALTITSPAPPPSTGVAKKKGAAEVEANDIALRAYYIAERRGKLGLPGDEMGDWVEAERQLSTEARRKSA
jgi:Protein of unknown function (DUF2934)